MTEAELEEKMFELRYWQQVIKDLEEIARHVRMVGQETKVAVELDPYSIAGAGDLLTSILARMESVRKLVRGLQKLVDGRLTAIEESARIR